MLNHKKSHSFWAFIYDWEDDTGVSFKIPMVSKEPHSKFTLLLIFAL